MIKSEPVPSPFMPVELQTLQTVNGKASSRQAVILDPQGSALEVGIVSPEYKLVKNSEVVQVAEDLLNRTGMPAENHQTLFNGKKFRQRYLLSQTVGEVKVGDVVACTLDAVNSYDGSTTFGLEFNAIRLICSNGMMLSFMLGGFRFKHWGSQNFDREMRVAARQLDRVGVQRHRRRHGLGYLQRDNRSIDTAGTIQRRKPESPCFAVLPVAKLIEGR